MPCLSHPPWLDNSNYTWPRVQVIKLITTQFYPPVYDFISLRSKYCPQHPDLRHRQSISSLNVRDKVSHPHKTTGKTVVLYIPIFTFLDSGRKEKGSGLNGGKHYPNLTCSSFLPEWNYIYWFLPSTQQLYQLIRSQFHRVTCAFILG
jgi:hypothetical protein